MSDKVYGLQFDGSDSDPDIRFASAAEAKQYIKDNSPDIYRRCEYQIDVVECSLMTNREAKLWVQDEMATVLDDDYPDTLDDLTVRLMDDFHFSNYESEEIIENYWKVS